MNKKFLKSATVTALGLIAAITLLVMFFTWSTLQPRRDRLVRCQPSRVNNGSLCEGIWLLTWKLVCSGLSERQNNESIRVAQRTSWEITPKTWLVSLRNLLGVVYQRRCRDLSRVLVGLIHSKAMAQWHSYSISRWTTYRLSVSPVVIPHWYLCRKLE